MPKIDISTLSPQERLTLIAELWESLETVTPEQAAELDPGLATADADLAGSATDIISRRTV